jgi:UDP-GlcNAc:undecaprenyl-phosphate/decaprenyl-phosphate GlcNAc-1-phosphate transferase
MLKTVLAFAVPVPAGQRTYLVSFLLGLVIALVVTPLAMRLAVRAGAVDRPDIRSAHKAPTPLWGGLAVFLGMWIPIGLLAFWDNRLTERLAVNVPQFVVLFLAGLVMLVVGMWDDRSGVRARVKLAFQVPLALAVVLAGVHFGRITIPFVGSYDLGIWGPMLTVLWIVGITNAINLADGLDGLAAGLTVVIAGANAAIAILYGFPLLAVTMCALAGAALGFLRHNFEPARVFLGDAGSLFLGMTLAISGVLVTLTERRGASLLPAILILGYPTLDTLLSIARRQMLGRPFFSPDRAHIHHRLVAMGLSHARASLLLVLVTLMTGVLAFGLILQNKVVLSVGAALTGAAALLGLRALGYSRYLRPSRVRELRPRMKLLYHFTELAKLRLSQATDPDTVVGLLHQASIEFGMPVVRIEHDGRPYGSASVWPLARGRSVSQMRHGGLEVSFASRVQRLNDDMDIELRLMLDEIVEEAGVRMAALKSATGRPPHRDAGQLTGTAVQA